MSQLTLQQQLANKVSNNTTVHAYIVEGHSNTIESSLYDCAKVLMCDYQGCGQCDTCIKIQTRSHPDCIFLPREDKITVKDISYLIEESCTCPVENSRCKVLLVNATNSLGIGSIIWQNKLLKTLEEPTDNIVILIGVENSQSLLPTIVSRCQVLSDKSDSVADICKSLCALGYNQDIAGVCAIMSQGDMREATAMVSNGIYNDLYAKVVDMLANLQSTKDSVLYVSRLTSNKNYNDKLLPMMMTVLSQSMMSRISPSLAVVKIEQMSAISDNYSIEACIAIIELINITNTQLAKGVNYTVAIDNLVANMLEVKYRCRK